MTERCKACGAEVSVNARFCGKCGAARIATSKAPPAEQPPADDMIGREIAGRYRIQRRIGEGGMGAVFMAEQISLKRQVALKVLKPELSNTAALVKRFNAEAEVAARLNHPNTVTLFDFGQDADGSLFIAMEYVEGKALRTVMHKAGPLDPSFVLQIAEQVCQSLADAHQNGIVHRDLKPDNVMLTKRGKKENVVMVLDFGIAKLRDVQGDITANPMTQAGDLLGTPQYMAPEQIRGEKVDGRTDVYAMGAMLYEMVTGRLPFEGKTVMQILSKHLTEMPTRPLERRPDISIPASLDLLIMQCLSKQPEGRPASMEALGDQLEAIHATMQTGVRPGTAPVGPLPGQAPTPAAAATPSPAVMSTPAPAFTPGVGHGAAPQSFTPANHGSKTGPGYPHAASHTPHNPSYGAAMVTEQTHPPAPKRSLAPLWIVLALVLLGGAAGATYVLAFHNKGGDEQKEEDDSTVPETPDTPPDQNKDHTVPADFDIDRLGSEDNKSDGDKVAESTEPAMTEHSLARGALKLSLPKDFNASGTATGDTLFIGRIQSSPVRVLVVTRSNAALRAERIRAHNVKQVGRALAQLVDGSFQGGRRKEVGGVRRPAGFIRRSKATESSCPFVVYEHGDGASAVVICFTPEFYDSAASTSVKNRFFNAQVRVASR